MFCGVPSHLPTQYCCECPPHRYMVDLLQQWREKSSEKGEKKQKNEEKQKETKHRQEKKEKETKERLADFVFRRWSPVKSEKVFNPIPTTNNHLQRRCAPLCVVVRCCVPLSAIVRLCA